MGEAITAPHVLIACARFYDRQGRTQEALDTYRQAWKHGSRDPVVLNDLGLFHARHSQWDRAREFLEQAVVRYHSGDFRVEWDARVVRLRERLDPRTRTAGLVVAVDRPYELAIPGQRPPLKQGMYCQVELRGATRSDRIVIPSAALHDGHVYLVGEDRRMVRRAVQVEFVQSDFVCLAGGLRPGDVVVVSDPEPAIEGLRLEPVPDEDLSQRLAAQASGTGAW